MLKVGDAVKHKTDKYLVKGHVKEIAKSGLRAKVELVQEENPKLLWPIRSYYRFDKLEKLEV